MSIVSCRDNGKSIWTSFSERLNDLDPLETNVILADSSDRSSCVTASSHSKSISSCLSSKDTGQHERAECKELTSMNSPNKSHHHHHHHHLGSSYVGRVRVPPSCIARPTTSAKFKLPSGPLLFEVRCPRRCLPAKIRGVRGVCRWVR